MGKSSRPALHRTAIWPESESSHYWFRRGSTAISTPLVVYATGAADTEYLVTVVATCKLSSAGATVTATLSYTDPSGTVQSPVLSAATCTTLGASSQSSATSGLNIKAGTNVTVSTTIVSTPTYDIRASITKLGGN